jgi:hypothetical protein
MNKISYLPLALGVTLATAAGTATASAASPAIPAVAAAIPVDASTIDWQRERAAYLRDLAFAAAADDSRNHAEYQQRAALINARYFVKNAEIDAVDLHDTHEAQQDLQRARPFLDRVERQTQGTEHAHLEAVMSELQADSAHPVPRCTWDNLRQQRQGYEHLAGRIGHLIKQV